MGGRKGLHVGRELGLGGILLQGARSCWDSQGQAGKGALGPCVAARQAGSRAHCLCPSQVYYWYAHRKQRGRQRRRAKVKPDWDLAPLLPAGEKALSELSVPAPALRGRAHVPAAAGSPHSARKCAHTRPRAQFWAGTAPSAAAPTAAGQNLGSGQRAVPERSCLGRGEMGHNPRGSMSWAGSGASLPAAQHRRQQGQTRTT